MAKNDNFQDKTLQVPALIYGSMDLDEPSFGNTRALHIDANTHSLITVDYDRHELNRGHIFIYTSYGELDGDGHKYFYFEAPTEGNGSTYFFRWRLSANDEWSVKIYGQPELEDEGNTPSGGGLVINKLIGSANTTDFILKEDGVVGSGTSGTLIAQHYGGIGHKEGSAVEGDPFIIQSGISFWADIHNENAGQATMVDWTFEWWEQTPKSDEDVLE